MCMDVAGDMGGRHNLYCMMDLIVDAVAIPLSADCISLDHFSIIIIMIIIDRITDYRDAVNNLTTNLLPANITRCIEDLIILFSYVISFKH